MRGRLGEKVMRDRRCKGRSCLAVIIPGLIVSWAVVLSPRWLQWMCTGISEGIRVLSVVKTKLNESMQIRSHQNCNSLAFSISLLHICTYLRSLKMVKTEAPSTSAVRNLSDSFIANRNQKSLPNIETWFWDISKATTPGCMSGKRFYH